MAEAVKSENRVGDKRKWIEDDWEVVLAAQTFVAVFASAEEAPEPSERKSTKAGKSNAKSKSRKKTKASKKAKTKASTRRSRSKAKKKEDDEGEEEQEGESDKQEKETETAAAAATEEFWLAQLQDDVTEDMLGTEDTMVRATWLNKQPNSANGLRYEFAYDEAIDVQSILCHVYLREMNDGTLELTPKSLARVQRSLARSKGEATGDDEDEADDERPPPTSRRQSRAADRETSSGAKTPRRGAGGAGKKLSKREMAMHIPPLYTTVDLDKYENREIYGTQPYTSFKDDVTSANREVLRAVVTKNHKLLKKLTTDKTAYKELSSFNAPQSVDESTTALQYAIDTDDTKAVSLLVTASKIDSKDLAAYPDVALPSHSTGKHTSAYSDYNRRAINASRGGKEGNNALLEDGQPSSGLDSDYIWNSRSASVRMLTLLYPTGDWNSGYRTAINVCQAARRGHRELVQKVIETLSRNGGWGFNDLHGKVLSSDPDEELPQFRSVSAIKQAHQTRMRPLHLAAINPNKKYLETLWESVGNEWGSVKDDQGYEPIHYAAGCEGTEPLQFLLERRCSLFGRTKTRYTPLMWAILTLREENAVLMLDHAEKEGGEILQQVVSERGPSSRQPVHYAAMHGCAKVLEKLLACGADVNNVSSDKSTPLCLAAKKGSLECVKLLLDHQAKVNVGDKLKKTPLIHAVKNGHVKVAAFLINAGANVNAFDTSENSAVHYAASYGWLSSLELLADAGAEFWARNCWGFVPLACALLKQRQNCSEFIFERDTKKQFLDFRDRQGRTMLFLQTKHSKNLGQIKYLLDKGLNPNICDSENEYPLQAMITRAAEAFKAANGSNRADDELKFYFEAIRLLLKHGAEPQYDLPLRITPYAEPAEDEILFQPLQLAMRGRQEDIFDLLLDDFDVNPDARSSDGSDAWMVAASLGERGDSFLEKLLKHQTKKKAPLQLDGRRGVGGKENFFHVVAANNPLHLILPKLVTQCVAKCSKTAQLMAEKNDKGFSPIMLLLQNERPAATVDLSHSKLADKLVEAKTGDAKYSELVGLFAQHTKDPNAFVQFIDVTAANKLADQAPTQLDNDSAQEEDAGDSEADNDDKGSDQNSNDEEETEVLEEDEIMEDEEDDEDAEEDEEEDEEEEEEEEEEDDDDDDEADHRKRKRKEDRNVDDDDAPKIQVKFQTALHLAANRKLRCDAPKTQTRWFGSNVMGILFEKQPTMFDTATINYPSYSQFMTPLHFAVTSNDIDTVKALLAHKANPNHSPERCASCRAAFFLPKEASSSSTCEANCDKNKLIETSLITAVKQNSTEIVKLLLKHRANTGAVAKLTRDTPLHLSLERDNGVITRELSSHGASIVKLNAAGAAPLLVAVNRNTTTIPAKEPHEGEVRYSAVSDRIVAANAPNKGSGKEPAVLVALRDSQAKLAVVQGDAYKRTPIHFAARNRDLTLLRALVNAAANKKSAVNLRDFLGRTPLHYAINAAVMSPDAAFHVERFLLHSGSDANAQDEFGLAPLHLALLKVDLAWQISYDDEQRRKKATEENVQQDDKGESYEEKKVKAFRKKLAKIPSNETDPVETLSNLVGVRGIRVNAQDMLGRSPLHLAAATGAFVSASSLLAVHENDRQKREAMELKDHEGVTPLGYAVLHLRQTTIMTLLQNQAHVAGKIPVKMRNQHNADKQPIFKTRSYFYHAVDHSLTGICHMLLNAKFSRRQAIEDAVRCGKFQLASNLVVGMDAADSDALLVRVNHKGDTLLHSLAKVKHPNFDKLAREIAWTLIDAGVGAKQRNQTGNSALHYAARTGNIHLMDFLLHNGCELNQVNAHGETPLLYALKKGLNLQNKAILDVLKYFIDEHPGLNMHVRDQSGMNVLTAFLDRFVDYMHKEPEYFEWIEKMLKRGVDPNGAFESRHPTKKLIKNEALAPQVSDNDTSFKMTPLIRAVYAKHEYARYHTMGLLLRYGAKITGADDHGNSVLMHLVARNLTNDVDLIVGKIKSIADPTDATHKSVQSLHVPHADVKHALTQANALGQTVLHFVIQPLEYGSYENTTMLEKLLALGGSLTARDKKKRSALDYCRAHSSRFIFRFLKKEHPQLVRESEDEFFAGSTDDEDAAMLSSPPPYSDDASAYLNECEANGKIKRKRIDPSVNSNCDVARVSRVFGPRDSDGKPVVGEEFDALLTKVDVKNGRFGLNVFYRLQLVHDEIQGVFVVFTNWGRIGEEGKFQNTPFHSQEDAVAEFKKIFRSKTGNAWDDRGDFAKHHKKYNLVQRVNLHTTVDKEITRSFAEAAKDKPLPPPTNPECAIPSVNEMLTAITDLHHLQLAAVENCDFSDDLPLANQDEMKSALAKLQDIREAIKQRDVVSEEIQKVSGDVTDAGSAALAELSTKHEEMTERVSEMSSRYYEIMPCNEDAFGSAIRAFNSVQDVDKEIVRIRLLIDIMEAYKMILGAKRHQLSRNPLEYCYNALQVRVAPLAVSSLEGKLLEQYFFNGIRMHERSSYRISNMFEVERRGETARFTEFLDQNPSFKTKHSNLLWHGTRRTNMMGILSQGLRIAPPEAPHQGYAYGKGLYFADVSAKSVDYCGSPYTIETTVATNDKNSGSSKKTTKRNVIYMLLCEVTLGKAKELSAPTFYEEIPEGLESVKALAQHIPDPEGSIVSPKAGSLLHLGKIGERGVSYPLTTLWAKTSPTPQPNNWYERNPKFTSETQDFLSAFADKAAVGDIETVDSKTDKEHFIQYVYDEHKLSLELLSKTENATGKEVCDASVRVRVENHGSTYTYTAQRWRNAFYSTKVDTDYSIVRPQLPLYSEFIVYREAQARIRYILEVQQV